MRIHPNYRPSLEAIRYQGKSLLFNDLTAVLTDFTEQQQPGDLSLHDHQTVQRAFQNLGLEKIIQRHTNMTVTVTMPDDPRSVDMACYVTMVSSANIFLQKFRQVGLSKERHGTDADYFLLTQEQIAEYSHTLRGSIDLAKGRVSGVFAKLPSPILIGRGAWWLFKLTPEQIAAIILHELGHLFTAFEVLVRTMTTNLAVATGWEGLQALTDPVQRLQLVHATTRALGVSVSEPEKLSAVGIEQPVFESVLIKAVADQPIYSAQRTLSYDARSSEFAADQFATRQGAGRALALALDTMDRLATLGYRQSRTSFLFMSMIRTAAVITAGIAVPLLVLPLTAMVLVASTLFSQPDIYDPPSARLARIRRDLVQVLKDTGLSPATRKQVLQDIEVLDQLREDVKEYKGVFDYLMLAISSRHRERFSQEKLQQQLEQIINNDLFVKSHQLSQLVK